MCLNLIFNSIYPKINRPLLVDFLKDFLEESNAQILVPRTLIK